MTTRNAEERSVTTGKTKERDAMTNTDKKKWSTPRLRIFVKTSTEERVLWLCKMDASGAGFGLHHNGCYSYCPDHTRCLDAAGS